MKKRLITRRAVVPVVAALGITAFCAGVAAATDSVTGTASAPGGLNVRLAANGSGSDLLNSPITAVIPYGSRIDITCTWPNDWVTGPWGSTDVWDGIDYYVTPDNVTHYVDPDNLVSDAWVNTGGDTSQMGLRSCYAVG
jgi:hypothetical protein